MGLPVALGEVLEESDAESEPVWQDDAVLLGLGDTEWEALPLSPEDAVGNTDELGATVPEIPLEGVTANEGLAEAVLEVDKDGEDDTDNEPDRVPEPQGVGEEERDVVVDIDSESVSVGLPVALGEALEESDAESEPVWHAEGDVVEEVD